MTGIEPPREPAAPPLLVVPLTAPEPPRKRNWTAVIVVLALVVLVLGTGAGFVLSAFGAYLTDTADRAAAERAVIAMDDAYRDADCEAFETVTTERARKRILGGDFSCELFAEAAAALTDGDEYIYSVTVRSVVKRGDEVVVRTAESYAEQSPKRYAYIVARSDGQWRITGYGAD